MLSSSGSPDPGLRRPLALLALFCLYFFRDPDREIPSGPVAVSPADGKVVAIKPEGGLNRLSIFLNVFDVHVNRTPIGGAIEKVHYQQGQFLVASREECSSDNEQNIVTVSRRRHHGDLQTDRRTDRPPHRLQQEARRPCRHRRAHRPDQVRLALRRAVRAGVGDHGPARRARLRRLQRDRAATRSEAPMSLKDRLVDPSSPDRRPRKAAYALPTLFTAGNIFLGYISILRSFQGAMLAASGTAGAAEHFTVAAQAIGAAVVLDGLDGRIARMTNTTSAFGREMDSLADVISFGLAPAVLAFAWGVQFIEPIIGVKVRGQIFNAGYFIAFLFLLCGACRLARFNVQVNPIPKNPGRPDRKYFVGLPIPAAAAMVAAVVWAQRCPADRAGGRSRVAGWGCWRCSASSW